MFCYLKRAAPNSIYGHKWDTDARSHQVMKAVLMNSADKKEGILGMKKTILNSDPKVELDWLHSDAFRQQEIPLDKEMGTGQLNASRAFTQFKPGEWGPADFVRQSEATRVPLIGWDSSFMFGDGLTNKYTFGQALKKGSYISMTLAWDRKVDLQDFGTDGKAGTNDKDKSEGNGKFDLNESFKSFDLTNLDLFLLPKGAKDALKPIDASISTVDSVEHIFFKIPEEKEYEFWVQQKDTPDRVQSYGLAWWAEGFTKISFSAPNYKVNENGTVVGSEITLLRTGDTSGTSTVNVAFADGTATGGADYSNSTQTITFAANQTRATVTVPISDDRLVENTENLTLKLINPSQGTEIGNQSTATLDILDNDTLTGGDPGDTLIGGNPNDTLIGGNPGDTLRGGNPGDTLIGGYPNDTLVGGYPSDTIVGGNRNDTLVGGTPRDTLVGGDVNVNDTLTGSDPNDTIAGRDHNDTLTGGDLNDTLIGTNLSDTLTGVDSNDTLTGVDSSDVLTGSDPDDTLISGGSRDTLAAGDRAILTSSKASNPLNSSSAQDTFRSNGSDGVNTVNLSATGVGSNFAPFEETQFLNLAPIGGLPSPT
jgi:Ca2+-binding RTX toxin-like protein